MIKITTVFHSLFSKKGAIQCDLSKGRWLGKQKSKSKRDMRYHAFKLGVLRVKGAIEEARRRFVSLRDNIKIVKLTQTIIMLQSAPYRAYNKITLLRQRYEHFYEEMKP